MKKPSISFNKDAVVTFAVRHVEKVMGAVFGLLACGLIWGGFEALRTMRPTTEQLPQTIVTESAAAAEHIDAVKIAPDDELTSEKGLAETVARWLSPKVAAAPTAAMLNKPLFSELARRSSPDILPIEDLHAVAGVAVLSVKAKPIGDRPGPDRPISLDAPGPAKPPKPPRGGPRGPTAPGTLPPGALSPEMAGMAGTAGVPGVPGQPATQGKIVPYVMVTGLIPVVKQRAEYARRFDTASFHDPTLDIPAWNGFDIEKTEVLTGAAEKWTRLDPKAIAKRYSADWAGLQPEPLLPMLTLPVDAERRDPTVSPLPFCIPVPQLADGAWGFNALHPWFVRYIERDAAERKARARKEQQDAQAGPGVFGGANAMPGMPGPGGFGGPGMMEGPGMSFTPSTPEMPGMPGVPGQTLVGPEYRLFRFVDLNVVPGRTYRYRVRTTCWNPNLNVPARHLTDVELAKQRTLQSPESEPSPPVVVPDGPQLLAQPLKKNELKKLKPGTVGLLILGEKAGGGGLALRKLLLEVGGVANVDPALNKRGDARSVGDAIETDRVLLDYRGKLEDRGETRTGKPTPPPEPLEMLFLRPDGSFELATSAESQPVIERYLPTLPGEDGGAPAAGGQPAPGVDSPFGNPFAPKR